MEPTSLMATIGIHIVCGKHKKYTTLFNPETNIDGIHEHVRHLFGSHLPNSFHLMFYSVETQKILTLNQNQLEYSRNPFRSDLNVENTLYVINTSDVNSDNDTQSGISCHESGSANHDCPSTAENEETRPQEDLPINNNTTNVNDVHSEDLLNALLNQEPADIALLLQTDFSSIHSEDPLAACSNDNQMNLNSSMNNTSLNDRGRNAENLSDALLDRREQSDQNRLGNNNNNSNFDHLSDTLSNEYQSDFDLLLGTFENNEFDSNDNLPVHNGDQSPNGIQADENPLINDLLTRIAIGSARPQEVDIPSPMEHSNVHQSLAELNTLQNTDSTPLYFSLDVKPEQKQIYKSDRYNQTVNGKTNGYVARVQGKKTVAQNRASVLPKLRIPKFYQNRSNARLAVFVVSEKLQNGYRIWLKHRDKGFLPKGHKHDTPSVNPIEFDLNEVYLTKEGDLKLDLKMTTLWDKLTKPDIVYKLTEERTIILHPAMHELSSPRLLCVIKVNHHFCWETFCLSVFIRKKIYPTRRLPIANTENLIRN